MQPSKIHVTCSLLLLAACGGIDPNRFGAPSAGEPQAGIAGYSFDAGVSASGGKKSKPAVPGEEWEPGREDGGRAGRSENGQPSDAGAGGEPSAGAAGGEGGADGDPVGGAGSGSGRAGSGSSPSGGGGNATNGGRGGNATNGGTATGGSGGTANGGRASNGGDASNGGASNGGSAASSGGASNGGNAATGGASSGPPPPSAGDVFFSEYVEGSASYKAIELYAVKSVTLTGCDLVTYSNGESRRSLALLGELAAGDVYVLCSPNLATLLGPVCDRSTSLIFNGNDAVALECDDVMLDVLGTAGVDPENGAWSGEGASTLNQTLRRRCGQAPDLDPSDPFDPAVEWLGLPTDTFDGLGDPRCG
jgi:hypothetical protein